MSHTKSALLARKEHHSVTKCFIGNLCNQVTKKRGLGEAWHSI